MASFARTKCYTTRIPDPLIRSVGWVRVISFMDFDATFVGQEVFSYLFGSFRSHGRRMSFNALGWPQKQPEPRTSLYSSFVIDWGFFDFEFETCYNFDTNHFATAEFGFGLEEEMESELELGSELVVGSQLLVGSELLGLVWVESELLGSKLLGSELLVGSEILGCEHQSQWTEPELEPDFQN